MRFLIIIIIFIFYFYSCTNNRHGETIVSEPKPDPWVYINRISDTLEETEFSIYNSFYKNLTIAQNSNFRVPSKYRIGQNKYLKLVLTSVESYDAVGVIWDYDNSCNIQFGLYNHMLIDDTFFKATYDNIDSVLFNYILGTFNKNNSDYPNARIRIYEIRETGQKEVIRTIDELAKGYMLFMNYYSELKYKKPFIKLSYKKQSKLMKEIPFEINYDFYRMYHFGRKPEVPKVK